MTVLEAAVWGTIVTCVVLIIIGSWSSENCDVPPGYDCKDKRCEKHRRKDMNIEAALIVSSGVAASGCLCQAMYEGATGTGKAGYYFVAGVLLAGVCAGLLV